MKKFLLFLLFLPHLVLSQVNTTGLTIVKSPVGPTDAQAGGLAAYRDTTGVKGGSPGFVNSTLYCRAIAGAGEASFEWCITAVLNNYATGGENVAGYFQGNKFSVGPTWGSVSEIADTVGAGGAAVGMEVDNWTTGLDNGLRIGVDVVVGDARVIRGQPGGGVAQATTGVRVSANGAASWANGAILRDYRNAGLVLQGPGTRGIWLQGKHTVAVDLGDVTGQTAIRLRAGGRITFDQYDQYSVRQDPVSQDLIFENAGTPLMRLTPGGHLYISGQLHQGQP